MRNHQHEQYAGSPSFKFRDIFYWIIEDIINNYSSIEGMDLPTENSINLQLKLDSKDILIKEKEFFDIIHEIKNRLTVLYSCSQLIERQIKQALENYDTLKYIFPEDFLETVELVCKEVVKTKRIVKDLDHAYRLDRNKET